MKYSKNIIIILLYSFSIACSNNKIIKPPKELAVTYKKNINDTVFISDQYKIEKIISLLNKSKVEPAKIKTNIWLSYVTDSSTVKIGINANRFKFNGKQYIGQNNLESKIKGLVNSSKSD